MAPFNTRIVRRSNALQGWAYGSGFRYREVMGFGRGPLGAGRSPPARRRASAALAVGMALAADPRGARPGPAQARRGAEREDPQRGHFRIEIDAHDHHGRALPHDGRDARATPATPRPR